MKRFTISLLCFFSFLFVFNLHLNEDSSFANTNKIIINTSYTYLYKTGDFLDHYDIKIKANEILVCLEENEKFYRVTYSFNDIDYTGFISTEVASIYTSPQDVILVYNGKIIKDTQVYEITSDNLIENIFLKPNHQIYLYEGFDAKKEYTNIKFKYEDKVYVGRVLTNNLSPNGVNKALIIALGMIVAFVGIILILLGLNKKKWHKRLKLKKK